MKSNATHNTADPTSSEPLITLTDDLLINRGRLRLCYRHPTNRDLVVKVPAGTKSFELGANLKEYKGYHDLLKRHGRLSCISHCHDFTITDRGQGLMCDCIRDEDGRIAHTLWDIIIHRDTCNLDHLVRVVRMFCSFLVKHDIWLFDLNPKNIALSRQLNGTYFPVALDLKGRYDNNEFIPVSSYISYFARKKMARRIRRLLERIEFLYVNRYRFRSDDQLLLEAGS